MDDQAQRRQRIIVMIHPVVVQGVVDLMLLSDLMLHHQNGRGLAATAVTPGSLARLKDPGAGARGRASAPFAVDMCHGFERCRSSQDSSLQRRNLRHRDGPPRGCRGDPPMRRCVRAGIHQMHLA